MIELVVFDIAGTTVHDGDGVASAFRAALAGAGVHPEPAAVTAVMGVRKPDAIRTLLAQAGKAGDVAAIHADFVRRMIDFYRTSPDIREVPGAAAAAAELRRAGVKVALNSGFSRDIVDVILTRLGWHPPAAFDAAVCSDEVPEGRPHPFMVRELMRRLGVADAARVAKAGDTMVDLQEGANAGCGLVIGVTSGACTADELRRGPHTHVVASVADVPALVRARG
ncbi:MAG: phosphonatase-like hydrolase [Gemmataceae bacterium]